MREREKEREMREREERERKRERERESNVMKSLQQKISSFFGKKCVQFHSFQCTNPTATYRKSRPGFLGIVSRRLKHVKLMENKINKGKRLGKHTK